MGSDHFICKNDDRCIEEFIFLKNVGLSSFVLIITSIFL